MSTFGGIQQALSSLSASQYGLQIVSQNIGNASTTGYTRQGVDLTALDSVSGVPRRYVTGGGPSGVSVSGTSRLNDPIVDARARMEHARSSLADTTTTQLGQIEDVFQEPSSTGLSAQLSQFWSDWGNVANNPSDTAARTVLLNDAGATANTINSMAQSLSDVSASATQSLQSDIAQANTAAQSLSTLNQQIQLANRTGVDHNALLDQRDQLLDQLSSLVGGVARINADGSANVVVGADPGTGLGGTALVTAAVPADPSATPPVAGAPAAVATLGVSGTGASTAITLDSGSGPTALTSPLTGGSAAASVTTLTGYVPPAGPPASPTTGVPFFQNSLDAVAQALASTVNGLQTSGFDANGNAGIAMFTVPASTGPGSVAAGIGLNPAIGGQPKLVAAAAAQTAGGNNDGSNALTASKSGSQAGSPDAAYATLIGKIGSQSQLAQQGQATQDAITSGVDAQRQSASGVNLDEEVTNMMTLQRTYQASSRVLSVMDSMLNTLINQMGAG